ncbi:MAG: UDP-N-acetylglucosamine pyrophosphorylase [Clostridia bacterium]|nr:UDP-N-acetylglucosamine pyrophosphorylase [Clostridia bacterium]
MSNIKINDLFNVKTEYLQELFNDCEYPWQILPKIKDYILKLQNNAPTGFIEYADGVLVGKNVKISKNATILAPVIIGANTEVRPGAYIRGNVIIGENCVIGNSSELKNCVLLNNVQVPHYNYVGDSILGNFSHLGAGSICSNLKADKSNVVIRGKTEFKTNLRKVGAILGDGADVGCNCVLNPGTVIGKNSRVYPLTSVRGVIDENSIVKSMNDIVIIKK